MEVNLPPIIGFAGRKGSGKDFAFKQLQLLYPKESFVRISFADALKEEVCKATGVKLAALEARKSEFRPMLQWWGTDFRRNMFDKEYWINRWIESTDKNKHNPFNRIVVATDVRFQNEVDIIKLLGGKVYFIFPRCRELSTDMHESELCNLSNLDGTLINDFERSTVLVDDIKYTIRK